MEENNKKPGKFEKETKDGDNEKETTVEQELLEAMEYNSLLRELIGKLKGLGIKNPNIDILKTALNNLKITLKDKGKSWKEKKKVEDIDIKYALLDGKDYTKDIRKEIGVYNYCIENMNLEGIYMLIEIEEIFKIKFSGFSEFLILYNNMKKNLRDKLDILECELLVPPRTSFDLICLNDMDENWLKKYVGKSQGNGIFKNLVDIRVRIKLFEGKSFTPKTQSDEDKLKNIRIGKLAIMINVAESQGCESFEEFMRLEKSPVVEYKYSKLRFFQQNSF